MNHQPVLQRSVYAAMLIALSMQSSVFGQEAPASGLQLFTNKAAGFQALMPEQPQYNAEKQGEGHVQHQFVCGTPSGVYMVALQDHPNLDGKPAEAVEAVYVKARDAFQGAIGGAPTSYQEIERDKMVGREMRFKIPARGGESRSQMFLVKDRWYHVFVMGMPEFVNSKEADRFLTSFKLLK